MHRELGGTEGQGEGRGQNQDIWLKLAKGIFHAIWHHAKSLKNCGELARGIAATCRLAGDRSVVGEQLRCASCVLQIYRYIIIIITIKYSNNFGLIFLNMHIINLYSQSLKNMLEFWKEFLNNQIIIEIVRKIYSQNSAYKKPKYEIEKINNIECGNTIFNKNICVNKNDLTNFEFIKNLINLNDPQNNIKINNIYLKDLKSLDFLHKKIIYITPKSNLIQIHNHSISLNILEILDQLESEEINIYATLLELEKHKNKIIIINENFNNIKNQFLLNEIKKILININQNNFLISNNSNNFLMDIYENFI